MRSCIICNNQFEPKASNTKICSQQCFVLHRRARGKRSAAARAIIRNCRLCNGEYKRISEKSGFCSRSCGAKWNIQQGNFETWKNSQLGKRSGEMISCSECGKKNYRVTNQKQFIPFCDKKCKYKFFAKAFSGENNPMFGKKLSDRALEKQKRTLLQNHGVSNAYFLAKHRSVSKAQKEILAHLSSSFPLAEFEGEKYFSSGTYRYFVDVFSEQKKVIIEFNGDYWHCNPAKYDAFFFHPKKKMTASEIWEYDEKKVNVLKDKGYNVFVVWENEYENDKSNVLKGLEESIKVL